MGNASGGSKGEGSKGTSLEGKSDKKDDVQKDSKEGKEALDNLRSYIDLLEKEKRILREIKSLESEKTDESVAQINAKKDELKLLDSQKKEYKGITKLVESTADSTAEQRQKKIDKATLFVNMSDG